MTQPGQCLRIHSSQAGVKGLDDIQYHVPEKVEELLWDYYSCFSMIFTSGATSAWHCLEKGIITGCTISMMLFILVMNLLVKAAEVECRGPLSRSRIHQPPIQAFMDDLTVIATSVLGCRWLLHSLERLVSWARMSFKPAKCKSLEVAGTGGGRVRRSKAVI